MDEALPKKHVCDECTGLNVFKVSMNTIDPQENLNRALSRLDVHTKANAVPSPPQSRDGLQPLESDRETPILGPFAFPRDEEFFWGPADGDIVSTVERSISNKQQVVYSLLSVGVSVPKVKKMLAHDNGVDLPRLLLTHHGPMFRNRFTALISQPVRSGAKIARMVVALLSTVLMKLVFKPQATRPQSVTELLHQMLCKNVLDMSKSNLEGH